MQLRRFVLILIALLLLGSGGVAIWQWQKRQQATPRFFPTAAPARSLEEIHQTWKTQVQTIIATYDQDQNALAARDQLVALMVAPADQQVHLNLVLALQAAIEKKPTASALWSAAKKELSS